MPTGEAKGGETEAQWETWHSTSKPNYGERWFIKLNANFERKNVTAYYYKASNSLYMVFWHPILCSFSFVREYKDLTAEMEKLMSGNIWIAWTGSAFVRLGKDILQYLKSSKSGV